MTYEKLENNMEIRKSFMKAHVSDDFKEEMHMWSCFKSEAKKVSFRKALLLLGEQEGPVMFISEGEGNNTFNNCALEEYEDDIKGYSAMADTDWLAEMIEYEWDNKITMWEDGFNLGSNDILPDDLYVFDKSYQWFIVFTHEIDEETDVRLCYAYNI